MRWEHLTVPGFAKAVEQCQGVCVLPVGVVEPHATHLPLGQDMLTCHWMACRAAEVEPVVVFPPYPWGINHESAHRPGAIVVRRDLVIAMLENLCNEIGRNGLTRIILLSGHGGNRFLLPLLVQTATERPRDYLIYTVTVPMLDETTRPLIETHDVGHAGEAETSTALHMFPDLVDMESVPSRPHPNSNRLGHLQEAGVYATTDWYSMYPTMYTGDASFASAEKGQAIMARCVERFVKAIRAVKNDTVAQGLLDEFTDMQKRPEPPAD